MKTTEVEAVETNFLEKGGLLEIVNPEGNITAEEVLEVETEIPIFVYTAPSCPQCKMVKKFLDKAGKPYEEIDGTTEGVREMLKEEGFKSFPVVKQGAVAFAGFRPDQLRKLV
jgi:hypothetical protein